MNEKQIELLKKEIEFLDSKIEDCKEVDKFLYNSDFDDLIGLFTPPYKLKEKKNQLQTKLKVYKLLTESNIDVDKDYYLFEDVYLSISGLRPFFYVDGGQWIYDNYINSWSGINEWVTDLIDTEYTLFSGNSSYCHAFGTSSLKDIFETIESSKTDPVKKASLLINLVEFTKEDGKYKDLREKVVKMIQFRFNVMKELLSNEKTY